MHIIFRETHGLEETETPFDLGQDPAEVVVLSFSDSDLGAFASGWHRAEGKLPSLRLANLVALRHPLSVDTYAENTLSGCKAILVRLIGGESYWPYGLATLNALAKRDHIALAILPADGRDDARLDELSTLPVSTLRQLSALCEAGGALAAQAALSQLALSAGLYAGPVVGEKIVPEWGFYDPGLGVLKTLPQNDRPEVVVTFYRSYLTAADTEPVDALIAALQSQGFAAHGAFASSLKAPHAAAWLADQLGSRPLAAIVNATAFSIQDGAGRTPFDGCSCPVFQVSLSTARRREWREAERGLSPADLAMHIALPEVDGRLFAGVVSFKSPGQRDPDLQYSRFEHRADCNRVAAAAGRIAAWHRLAVTPAAFRNIAIVLSTYPGRTYQMAHAVGLDTLASTEALLTDLASEGYSVTDCQDLGQVLMRDTIEWPVSNYLDASDRLPEPLQASLKEAWGEPEGDPAYRNGYFRFSAVRYGTALVALQPERGEIGSRDDDYHDLSRTPRHGYVAFYLWLQEQAPHALIHMGAHGTLEWLPGKSVALSETCWPEALVNQLPVIYPFIVNDPGEAAQAKRRIGAVTLGHMPPPLTDAKLPDQLARLEQLVDEYSNADGFDPARRQRLVGEIRDEARTAGVEEDLGLSHDASAAEAITRIDRFVCDIKESQLGEGLHVLGRGEYGAAERGALLTALSGGRIEPGPAGSPYRGRSDVLPTGRNLFSVDPRAVPTPTAHAQGIKLAEELVRRHLQDHGDWPRGLVVDLWGSATMRTAGEDFAMALHLAGLKPTWDHGSGRVTGFEVLALALIGRPRIDVTLRVSGLFRDIFPGLAQLFEAGAEALSKRDETPEDNPYLTRTARVFCPKPGEYGLRMGSLVDDFTTAARNAAAEAWLAASSWALGTDGIARADRAGIEARVKSAEAFVHTQDLPETDLLMAADYAAHEAGFAAAARRLSEESSQPTPAPALYHLDATRPGAPRSRSLTEEIARVVRSRAANPDWADGMMLHGFRGAAEIAATLDHMAAFAHLSDAVPAHLFDLYHEATLGRSEVVEFMGRENPVALAALRGTFQRLREAQLWVTRRNSIVASLGDGP